ncbi:MAG: hypothetical protein JNM18_13580 [Planctomycetaceae bacterium]|nr:hypothetical protein [Planctomycetaceae bacterium]
MLFRFVCLYCSLCIASAWPLAALFASDKRGILESVLGVIEDFDDLPSGPFQEGFLDSWRWTEEFRLQARSKSRMEVVDIASGEGKALRVLIHDSQLLAEESMSLVRLTPFCPPEADALRVRLKIVSGQAVIYCGGPTAYYGNSDVYTEPQTIRASVEPRWVDVVCNFNHPTWRNYRRSSFSTDAPRNYYNRWAQEPIGVFVAAGTEGEFLIDRIDLLAMGEGKPFASFAPDQIQPRKMIADFEDRCLDRTFNLYMADAEAEWFEQSWKREKPLRFAPQRFSVVDNGHDGQRSLASRGRTAEEVQCTGVRTEGDGQANALAVTIAVDAPDQRNTLIGTGPTVPIDFLIFVAPTSRPFPWHRFAPANNLRAFPGPGFDYQMSYRTIRTYADVDFAIYQSRRYLEPGKWTKLVLPKADFTCVYGHGSYRSRLVHNQPLTCDEVIAVAWLNPWCRVGRRDSDVTTRIDQVAFVQVMGSAAEHRSFWQVSNDNELLFREERSPRGRFGHFSLPGDQVAPANK